MKGSLVIFFSLCLAATCLEPAYASIVFMTPCPMGCIQTECLFNVGCPLGKCKPGWCTRSGGSHMGMICSLGCPSGEFCSGGIVSFCTACGVNNCLRCTNRYTCNACKTGYTLSSDNRQCISLFR